MGGFCLLVERHQEGSVPVPELIFKKKINFDNIFCPKVGCTVMQPEIGLVTSFTPTRVMGTPFQTKAGGNYSLVG